VQAPPVTHGKVPGMPVQISHTALLGTAVVKSTTLHPQNIFDEVSNSAWTSRPMMGSKDGTIWNSFIFAGSQDNGLISRIGSGDQLSAISDQH
jgi:hypothetical protein